MEVGSKRLKRTQVYAAGGREAQNVRTVRGIFENPSEPTFCYLTA